MSLPPQAPPPSHPKLEAHLRDGNRLLRRAADMLAEVTNEHATPPYYKDVDRLVRQIDHHLERGRRL